MVLCDDFFGINFIILKFSLYILESQKLYRCYKLPQNSKSNWFFFFPSSSLWEEMIFLGVEEK